MNSSSQMVSSLPIGAYMHRGFNTYDPRVSVRDQNLLDQHVNILQDIVQNDHGLSERKKEHFKYMLGGPEHAERMFAGITGSMLAKSIRIYSQLSPPAQGLLSLAGFGLGNIIYNEFHSDKFTEHDEGSGRTTLKL